MILSETEKKFEEVISEFDALIKAGQIAIVSPKISKLNLASVPRNLRQSLAKICRRVGLISHGLRLLQPVIRQEGKLAEPATASEICEYAVLLSRNGSLSEAKNLLMEVNAHATPEAHLYLGYCHVSNWNYAEAIGCFEDFLKSETDAYSKLVARVNLSAAYITIKRFSDAEELLRETISLLEPVKAIRLIGNCYELLGQVQFFQSNFAVSRNYLNQCLEIFKNTPSYDQLLPHKWLSLMTAMEEKSVVPIAKFRQEAMERKHWESVRDSDLYTAILRFEQRLLDHLIFGTPMPAYRSRIQERVGAAPSSSYIFGEPNSACLDLKSGELNGVKILSPGQKIQKVFEALLLDFYIPRNVGTLFAELYPGEFFDINSSPLRVRQHLKRARIWMKENQIPVSIQQESGTYRLTIDGSFGIRLELEKGSADTHYMKWEQLKKVFISHPNFTAEDACKKLQWSRSSFRRLAEWAMRHQLLEKSGSSTSTRYQIISSVPVKKPAA